MKKTLSFVIVITLLVGLFGGIGYADAPVEVKVDGKILNFEEQPYIENNTTMVPVRGIAEALGAEVEWNQEKKEVVIKQGKFVVYATKDNYQMKNGRTFVPLRFVSESLGAKVEWNQETRTVTITPGEEKVIPEYIQEVIDSGKYAGVVNIRDVENLDEAIKTCEAIFIAAKYYPTQANEVLGKIRTTIESNGEYTGTFDDRALEIRKTEDGYKVCVGKKVEIEQPTQNPVKPSVSKKEYKELSDFEKVSTQDVVALKNVKFRLNERLDFDTKPIDNVYYLKKSDLPIKVGNSVITDINLETDNWGLKQMLISGYVLENEVGSYSFALGFLDNDNTYRDRKTVIFGQKYYDSLVGKYPNLKGLQEFEKNINILDAQKGEKFTYLTPVVTSKDVDFDNKWNQFSISKPKYITLYSYTHGENIILFDNFLK